LLYALVVRRWLVVIALVACDRRAPFDIPTMTRQLTAAGYAVTPAAVPKNLASIPKDPGVTGVACIDAKKGATTDTFCVIRCSSNAACEAAAEDTGETYGVWQRGPSVIVHQDCAHTSTSFDCVSARKAIGE
jgi:hypothetical protein